MSSFSKNQIYYTVVKKMNAKKHNISFSGTGILLSVTFKKNNKELIKKLYNLDIKYKAIPNLYFNDLFANRYLKRYFGQSYNKFKLNTKNIIKKQKIFTKISNKL